MLLFCKPNDDTITQIIISTSRIFEIVAAGCRVNINYDSGEVAEVSEGTYQKKIETVSVIYDSVDDVEKAIRQFYKAVNNHSAAFFFGNINQNK